MSMRSRLALIGLAAAVAVSGLLVASNQGFTIVRQLKAADGGVESAIGKNTLGLPYRTRNNLTMASELFNDIGADKVVMIQRYDAATDTFVDYMPGEPDFALVPGHGYLVTVSQDVNYRIFGSHDPEVIIPLVSGNSPESVSGTNWISLPYHSTSTTASELFAEIGSSNVDSIERYVAATDTFQPYTSGTADFPLEKGAAYKVVVSEDTAFAPNHF